MFLGIKKRIQEFIQKTLLGIKRHTKKNIEVKEDKNYYYGKKRKKSRKEGRKKSF